MGHGLAATELSGWPPPTAQDMVHVKLGGGFEPTFFWSELKWVGDKRVMFVLRYELVTAGVMINSTYWTEEKKPVDFMSRFQVFASCLRPFSFFVGSDGFCMPFGVES